MKTPQNLKLSPHFPIFLETFKYPKDILILSGQAWDKNLRC